MSGPAAQAANGHQRPAITVAGLTKNFGEIKAVRGIDFEVPVGETFGFLGPNGAGKSTTIKMLCTLARPTSGSAWVAGHEVTAERDAVRRNIGLVFQDTTLDNYLTGAQNLRFHADLYGVPAAAVAPRMQQVMEMVGLWDRRDSLVMTYSGGMQRRLEIARGLLHAPRVLFLDEPTVGLDPQTSTSTGSPSSTTGRSWRSTRRRRSRPASARTGCRSRPATTRPPSTSSAASSGSRPPCTRARSRSPWPAGRSSCRGCSRGSRCRSGR